MALHRGTWLGTFFGFAAATCAAAAAPAPSESADVKRFYALPPGAVARLGDLTFRHGGYPAAAFSHDGRFYYTGGGLNEIRVWDVATGRLIRRFNLAPIRAAISRVLALPDGNLVVHALDGFALLVDPKKGTILREVRAPGADNNVCSVAVSPGGEILAIGDQCGKILLQRVATGEAVPFAGAHPVRKERVASGWIKHLAFSPDGKRLLSDGLYDRRRLWDLKSGKEVRSFAPEEFTSGVAAFSPDGKLLAYSRPVDPKHFMNGPFASVLYRVEPFEPAVELDRPGYASDAAFVSGGRTLVLGGFTFGAWDVKSGKRLFAHRMPSTYGHLALSRDEKYAVFEGRWFELATGKERFFDTGHVGGIRAVALHERVAATGSDDGTVRAWEAETGKQLWRRTLGDDLTAPISLAFSPKGNEIAVLCDDEHVRVLDVKTGKERLRTEKVTGQATTVRWSPDGRWIAAGGGSYTLFLFDDDGGKLRKKLIGYDGSMNTDWSFAFSPDGKTIVAPVRYNGSDFAGGKAGLRRPRDLGPDDYDPRLGPPNDPAERGKTYLALWDVASGKRLRVLGVGRHEAVFSEDGKTIATWGEDNQVSLRDVATGKELQKLRITRGPITSLRGRTLIVGGQAYNTADGALLRDWAAGQRYAAVSPSGKRLITAGWHDSTALVWEVDK